MSDPVVELELRRPEAEEIQGALSDVLCWIRGWRAAASEDALANDPLGVETLRDFNRKLKVAIDKAAG